MRVKAIKIIRSSHLSPDVVLPGMLGEVLTERIELTGRKLYRIRWSNGVECVALPTDLEEQVEALDLAAPADRPVEAASSSHGDAHTGRSDWPGQEPVGTLPHFHRHEWLFSREWYSALYDLGGGS